MRCKVEFNPQPFLSLADKIGDHIVTDGGGKTEGTRNVVKELNIRSELHMCVLLTLRYLSRVNIDPGWFKNI
jgi:hypothetical protein